MTVTIQSILLKIKLPPGIVKKTLGSFINHHILHWLIISTREEIIVNVKTTVLQNYISYLVMASTAIYQMT